jgi:hypothetical protein
MLLPLPMRGEGQGKGQAHERSLAHLPFPLALSVVETRAIVD